MDNQFASTGNPEDRNNSFVVTLASGRSFELSFEQLLAHTMRLQDKRSATCETWDRLDGQDLTAGRRGMRDGTPLQDSTS